MRYSILVPGVFLMVLLSSAAIACGDPRDPNGCTADYYYILKSYPQSCFYPEKTPYGGEVFKSGILNNVPLPPVECVKQVAEVEGYERKEGKTRGEADGMAAVESRLLARIGEYLYKYPLRNLFDGDPVTPWVEWLPGSGVGVSIVVGSNSQELTFNKIRIVNGCARDSEMYENNNRIKELAVFAPGRTPQYLVLEDTSTLQTLDIDTFTAAGIAVGIASVYKGRKFDDTCISEIQFGTNERGFWPAPAKDIVELHPVYPVDKTMGFDSYTYPSYDFHHNGNNVGTITSDFLEFSISSGGAVLINEHYGKPPITLTNFSDVNGRVNTRNGTGKFPELDGNDTIELIGWFPENKVCVMADGDKKPSTFLMYALDGGKLKLLRKALVPAETINALRKAKADGISFLQGKEGIYLRQFCSE